MRNRYQVTGPFYAQQMVGPFAVQAADITDKVNGTVYRDGAYRVIDTRTGRPAKVGKGGTVPFYGEMAWADAERLANDLAMAEAYA